MFSTFTGNSKRPRNVNLSGQAGNPFANTSWSPAAVSNATKTVSDAQAEREKRQVERQRLKAAVTIQKVWRGHKARAALAESWRTAFDDIYRSAPSSSPSERLSPAFSLLLAFFSARRADDVQRVFLFSHDWEMAGIDQTSPINVRSARLQRFVEILVKSLDVISSKGYVHSTGFCCHCQLFDIWVKRLLTTHSSDIPQELEQLLGLIIRTASHVPLAIAASVDQYYKGLSQLCRVRQAGKWKELLTEALTTPLKVASGDGM